MIVKAWQIHPKACRIEKAEKTCMGFANKAGVKWCGPYVNANMSGFWVYSPIEIDFIFEGDKFTVYGMEDYGPEDYERVKSLVKPEDRSELEKWCFPGSGRTKTTFGLVEKNVIQLWTGLIFETPPGWCLHMRSPINFPKGDIEVMEAILETDWMQYDIWINVACKQGVRTKITKDMPIAHIVPTRREGFKADWSLERNDINRKSPDAERVFKYWLDYNKKKFEMGGRQALTETLTKDSTTYFRERSRIVGKEMEPLEHVLKCPFHKSLEEELEEFEKQKTKAEYFAVFEKDKSQSLRIIADGNKK